MMIQRWYFKETKDQYSIVLEAKRSKQDEKNEQQMGDSVET